MGEKLMPAWLNRALANELAIESAIKFEKSKLACQKEFIVGFTGTAAGMTIAQQETVESLLKACKPHLIVHGDCVGADTDLHEIAKKLDIPIRLRPCNHKTKRAHNKNSFESYAEKDPLERNKDIVFDANMMIATPSSPVEEVRSGTWMTIRWARKMKKSLFIVNPDGSIASELCSEHLND